MAEFSFTFPEDGKSWTGRIKHKGRYWSEKWVWQPGGFVCTTPDWDADLPEDIRAKAGELAFEPGEVAVGLQALWVEPQPEGDDQDIDLFDDIFPRPDDGKPS